MWICENCGNKKRFSLTQDTSGWETVFIDGETDEEGDVLDGETNDTSNGEYNCMNCEGGSPAWCDDEKEILEIKWKYTDKKGKWNKNVLDEKDRNKRLGNKLLLESI